MGWMQRREAWWLSSGRTPTGIGGDTRRTTSTPALNVSQFPNSTAKFGHGPDIWVTVGGADRARHALGECAWVALPSDGSLPKRLFLRHSRRISLSCRPCCAQDPTELTSHA